MQRLLSLILGIWLLAAAIPAQAATVLTPEQWVPKSGDEFFVDVETNTGYLVHSDARYLPFLLATGAHKTIYYLGRTYYAATPVRSWTVTERKIQTERTMFGKTRRFFRLSDTAYGIHSYKDIEQWLKSPMRYRSYGCIVVSEQILDLIEDTYAANGNTLRVTTYSGSEKFLDVIAFKEDLHADLDQ